MDALLITVAILLSVVLLFKYAVPIGRPKISVGERLSDSALKNKFIVLGKSCAVVRRGFGIYYRHFDVKKVLCEIKAKRAHGIKLFAWENALSSAEVALSAAYESSLDTVRLSYTLGHAFGLPRIYLFCSELVKSRNGDIRKSMLDIATSAFCVHSELTDAERNAIPGMILFCICGLLCALATGGNAIGKSYRRGASDGGNGKIDLDGISDVNYLSGVLDGVPSAERDAVVGIAENNGIDCADASLSHKKILAEYYAIVKASLRSVEYITAQYSDRSRARTRAKNAVSKRKEVFFNSAPIVLTVLFAAFTCVFVPVDYSAVVPVASIIFYGCFRLPMLLDSPKYYCLDLTALLSRILFRRRAVPHAVGVNSEFAYFGDEPQYLCNEIYGGAVLSCNNRGKISVADNDIDISFKHNGKVYRLSEFCGVALRGKTVYRTFTDSLELSVELTSAVDCACCIARIIIINRSDKNACVTIFCKASAGERGVCGINIGGKNCYGGDGNYNMRVPAFSAENTSLVVAYGESVPEISRIFDSVLSDGAFEYASDCSGECRRGDLPSGVEHHNTLWKCSDVAQDNIIPSLRNSAHGGHNTLISGNIALELCADGIKRCFRINDGTDVLPCDDNEKIYLLFGSGDVLRSPFDGNARVKHTIGHTSYQCGFDGIFCKTKCSAAAEIGGFLFDVVLKNTYAARREIDILFSATAPVGAEVKCEKGMLSALGQNTNFMLSCSQSFDEYSVCKEGWFARGRPSRIKRFRVGGSTPAAVMHIKVHLLPYENKRVNFLLTTTAATLPNARLEENSTEHNKEFASRFNGIVLRTDSKALNSAFEKALYIAYTDGSANRNILTAAERSACVCAVDYVSKQAAREQILDMLCKYPPSGESGVYSAYAVAHHIMLHGDADILKTRIERKFSAPCSVLAYCLRALDGYVPENKTVGLENTVFYLVFSRAASVFSQLCHDDMRIVDYARKAEKLLDVYCNKNYYNNINISTDTDKLLHCRILYAYNKLDSAYGLIEEFTKKLSNGESVNPSDCALYCLLIIEQLLGIKRRGNRVKISPRIAESTPHIEYDLRNGSIAHIIIDESVKRGEWRLRVGGVAYALDGFKVSGDRDETLIFYRSGVER